ncbi:HutD family protein [Rhodopseudomonas sp. B29]|uniref:HutD/Ves family protein n=1 Tax=Rhodopseudomonas sp. B29 TaxID=95607 RepID=UPI000346AF05|nr:HutD family protein [Rhodopseudomonas sp. B29]
MQIIRAGSCRVTPWKNGGGSTTEIAVSPQGATFDDFDWRISMACVGRDGPFSTFPQIDRTLAVLSGRGMILTIDGRDPVTLTPESEPVVFPGDVPTSAKLVAGDILDLNVMTRRGRFTHRLQNVAETASLAFDAWEIAVVISARGRVQLSGGAEPVELSGGDAAVLHKATMTSFGLQLGHDCNCYLAWLRPA